MGAVQPQRRDQLAGALLWLVAALIVLDEAQLVEGVGTAVEIAVFVLLAALAPTVGRASLAFLAVGLALVGATALLSPTPGADVREAAALAGFIGAFFTALSLLRHVADTSPAIRRCGRYLANQPPGRRYAALTVGGQLFALILNYGAIALLGNLAVSSAREEQDETIRQIRTRRMLLAIQRGFLSALPWSPLSYAVALTTTFVAGTSWASAVLPGFVTGALMAGTGYALDTIFKPRRTVPVPPRVIDDRWHAVAPLLILLGVLVVGVVALQLITGARVVIIVIVFVPLLSVVWLALQRQRGGDPVFARLIQYGGRELPNYRDTLVLLMMAGAIGSLGADRLAPLLAASGIDLAAIPATVLLISLVWLFPLLGQVGMNPILSSALIAPLLPSAASIGVSPIAILTAITAGWALAGASSPFTATTLLIGSFANRSALHVGLRWNGLYTLVTAVVLSLWVALAAQLLPT